MAKRLEEKAMLVKLSISTWSARRHDKKVSDEVADMKGADKDAGRYNKMLFSGDSVASKIVKYAALAREDHYDLTLPWLDDGYRILPSKNYDRYMKKMREQRAGFDALVAELSSTYDALVGDAKTRLKDMFNAGDYPRPAEIARRYAFDVNISPIPAAGDFRVSLSSDDTEQIKKEIEQRMKAAEAAAMRDVWNRLHDVVKKMAEKMSDKDAVFRDTLITNMCELAELLPALNITDDPELEKMRRQVEKTLCSYEPKALRNDDKERAAAARDAQAILDAMAGYMGGAK